MKYSPAPPRTSLSALDSFDISKPLDFSILTPFEHT
jgi:hypothetical protein